jgi:hypothetical protein
MTARSERRHVAEQTMGDHPMMVYSDVADDVRWHQLDHRRQRRGLARLLTVAHRGYKRVLYRMLHHRYLRIAIGALCKFNSDEYVKPLAVSLHGGFIVKSVFVMEIIIRTLGLGVFILTLPLFIPLAIKLIFSPFMLIDLPLFISLTIRFMFIPWYMDKTLREHHITTHVVLDNHLQEHTIIVSTMNEQYTAKHVKMTEAELDTNEYVYHVRHDLRPLTIWSTIPLSEDQITTLAGRDFLMAQQRVESSDARYDLHDDQQISDAHADACLPLYYQCVNLLDDNRRLIEHIGQPALADRLDEMTRNLSDVKNHGLDISSDMTISELNAMHAQLDHMHDQLLVLNEDYISVHHTTISLSDINTQLDTMASTVSTVMSE